jgi:hypothetical protein
MEQGGESKHQLNGPPSKTLVTEGREGKNSQRIGTWGDERKKEREGEEVPRIQRNAHQNQEGEKERNITE